MAILDIRGLRKIVRTMSAPARAEALRQALERVMALVEAKSVQLAPVDTGNLEGSTVIQVDVRGKTAKGTIAFATPYAAAQHEGVDPRTGAQFTPGPFTQRKPGNEFGPPGAKYLERPLRGARQYVPEVVAEAIQDAWAEAK